MRQTSFTLSPTAGARLAPLRVCAKCGEVLVGPESSIHLGGGRIRHSWSCDSCGARHETATSIAEPARRRSRATD
jgi:hypothetical protein